MASGSLIFSGIPQLPDNWWLGKPANDPADVWTVWDKNTFYGWGANSGNYQGIAIGQSLHGGGMADPIIGPSRGRAHPHYVGIITMSLYDNPKNDPVFAALAQEIANGNNIVIPSHHGRLSLGTGIGATVPNWGDIQKYLLAKIYDLGTKAGAVKIPHGTFWPDCRTDPATNHPIKKLDDINDIVNNVLK
ncbi:MAG TPA: hypothetical protein VLL54_03040 [Pyrinomonadaceae bacterium]|nr:hypothetical protein [Pyrinomonadaceae bacterium]